MSNNTIKTEVEIMKNEIFNMKKTAEDNKDQNTKEHTELKKLIEDFINSADNKYAPAWVGKLVYGIISAIIIGLIVQSLK